MNIREHCFIIRNEDGDFWSSKKSDWCSKIYDADFFETESLAKCRLGSDVRHWAHPAENSDTAKVVEVELSVIDEEY